MSQNQSCFSLNFERFRAQLAAIPTAHYAIFLLLLTLIAFGCNLDLRHFSGADEPRVAGVSVGYTLMSDWRVPFLNGQPFLEQPPLFYWIQAWLFKFFNESYTIGKLPSVLMAAAGVLGVFDIARKFRQSGFTCFTAGFVLMSCFQYHDRARNSTVDMMLTGFIVLAVWAFAGLYHSRHQGRQLLWAILTGTMMAAAFMTKGLVGMAVPGIGIGGFLLLSNWLIDRKFTWKPWFYTAIAGVVSLGLPTWWALELFEAQGMEAVKAIYWDNNFGRFFGSGDFADHGGPWYEYLIRLPEYFSAWQIFLPLGLFFYAKRYYRMARRQAGEVSPENQYFSLLAGCLVLLPFIMLSAASGKRTVYLLVLYPFEALWLAPVILEFFGLVDGQFDIWKRESWQWRKGTFSIPRPLIGKILTLLLLWGYLVSGLVALVASIWLQTWGIGVTALALCIFGVFGLRQVHKCRFRNAAIALFSGTALLLGCADLAGANNRSESFQYLFDMVEEIHQQEKRPVALYMPTERVRGAAVYYLQEVAAVANSPAEAKRLLGEGYCVVFGHALKPDEVRNTFGSGTEYRTLKIRKDIFSVVTVPIAANGD